MPKELRGKRLDVTLAAIRRQAGQAAPQVLDKTTAGVHLDVQVSQPKQAPDAPVNDPVEGIWEVVKTSGKLPDAFPAGQPIRITRATDESGRLKEDLWAGKGGDVELFLNRPKNENRIYDGTASAGAADAPTQLQLLPPGSHSVFPYCDVQGLEQQTVLCGWWVTEPPCRACGTPIVKPGDQARIVVLRRVSD